MNRPSFLKTEWERTTTRRLLRWLFGWVVLRVLLVAVGSVATLIALFYAVENWRGTHALNRYRAEWKAKGEVYDPNELIPPPVPDAQNFAMTPLLKPLLDYVPDSHPVQWRDPAGNEHLRGIGLGLYSKRRMAEPKMGPNRLYDLKGWQAFYRGNTNYPQPTVPGSPAQDVLTALSKFDRDFQELQEASARPFARFPVHYSEGDPFALLLPHLATMKSLAIVLALRGTARLEASQPQEALADLQLGLRLSDSLQTEPILISHLVRLAMVDITLQIVREGLARHAWNDAQLTTLERRLASFELLPENKRVMRAERAWDCVGLEYFQRKGWPYDPGLTSEKGEYNAEKVTLLLCALRLMPTGWVRQNELRICRMIQDHILLAVDEGQRRVYPDRAEELEQAMGSCRTGPYTLLARLFLPALARPIERMAMTQTRVDMCRLACALERYRLAQGRFPQSLEALVPRFIERVPRDLMDGAPLRYERTDSTYLLYSVGWNQQDDGGVVLPRGRPFTSWSREGDWVWPCPVQ